MNKYLSSTNRCRIWNLYGPAEITIGCTIHLVDATSNQSSIPIGSLIPGYRYVILDEFFEHVFIGQVGELFVAGMGIFAGYLGRDDLTKNALVNMHGEMFYRTGDLVRVDSYGLLHYVIRKDHQVKLRGQRIELGEIERCLLNSSSHVTGSVVVKWGENYLVAYVQGDDISIDQLREYCQSHLAPFMVPSIFIVLKQLPLNPNGKLDRKCLPTPDFSALAYSHNNDQLPLTVLEERLLSVFTQVFRVESPNVNISFGKLGGTSLDAIMVLSRIRQEFCKNVNIGLLYDNPSVRQLARVLEPLIIAQEEVPTTSVPTQVKVDHHRPMPSILIEGLGIIFLVCQWLSPVWAMYCSGWSFAILLAPVIHLLAYVICQRLLLWPGENLEKVDTLYSWRYYRCWFLERLWSINNSYWLKHLLGTPFYNSYLRLCGAKIGRGAHIYSTMIDAPWLLEVGNSTFIDTDTILSNLSYYDQTYELHLISIGSNCSIGTRCVLYGEVTVQDYVYVKSMSTVTGFLSPTTEYTSMKDRSFSWNQIIYQVTCLLSLVLIHGSLLNLTYRIYQFCLTLCVPTPIALASCWLFWAIASLFVVTFLLKFIVGSITPGNYPINSYYFLHRQWLRQLIISSFHRSYDFITSYDTISKRSSMLVGRRHRRRRQAR